MLVARPKVGGGELVGFESRSVVKDLKPIELLRTRRLTLLMSLRTEG